MKKRMLGAMAAPVLVLAALASTGTPADAAVIGTLTFTPAVGTSSTLVDMDTSGPCDNGTNFKIVGSGSGIQTASQNFYGNTSLFTPPRNPKPQLDLWPV